MNKKMPKVGDKIQRFMEVESGKENSGIDIENRTVEVAFATEAPYQRWWGMEITDLTKMDLTRLRNKAAVLFNHNWDQLIGVVENVRIDSDLVARATVRFGNSALAKEKFQDVVDGILTKISYGYEITEMDLLEEKDGMGTYAVATLPFELSFVSIPADDLAGVNKSLDTGTAVSVDNNLTLGVSEMENEKTMETVEKQEIDLEAVKKEAAEKALIEQKAYEKEIKEVCKLAGFEKEAEGFISENVKPEFVREKLAEMRSAQDTKEIATVRIETSDENVKKLREERVNQMAHLLNPKQSKASNVVKFDGVHGLIKTLAHEKGTDVSFLGGEDLRDLVLTRDHSTSDFPLILADAANKVLKDSYEGLLAVQTFRPLVSERMVRDYKNINITRLGESPDLKVKPEGAATEFGTVSETGDSYKVEDYSRGLALTDRALRDDDLGAFSKGLLMFSSAAARKESEVFWDQFVNGLVDNATMYSVGRNTLHATTALDVAGLSKLRTAMKKQKGLDSTDPLNIMAKYLIVPAELETEAEQLMNQTMLPNSVGTVNPFAGKLQIIADARLADGAWYLAGDNMMVDLFEIAYLNGRRAPRLKQKENFYTNSIEAIVDHTFAVKAIDYRGLQKATEA